LGFGQVFMLLFFVALSFAAFTSLIAQVEVMVRAIVDTGMNRVRATTIVGIATFVLGMPSAISMNVLNNQDWVWGVALMLAGLFFCVSAIPYGVKRFREEQLNHADSNIRIGAWWDIVIRFLAPVQMTFLLVWFMIQSYRDNPVSWLAFYDRDNIFNVGTVVWQFAIVLSTLIALNKWIVKKTLNKDAKESPTRH
jgi:NSS family neurotransmitter:Na+ symporter